MVIKKGYKNFTILFFFWCFFTHLLTNAQDIFSEIEHSSKKVSKPFFANSSLEFSIGLSHPFSRLEVSKPFPPSVYFLNRHGLWPLGYKISFQYMLMPQIGIGVNIRYTPYENGITYRFITERFPDGSIKGTSSYYTNSGSHYLQYGIDITFKSLNIKNKFHVTNSYGFYYMPLNITAAPSDGDAINSSITKLTYTEYSVRLDSSYNFVFLISLSVNRMLNNNNTFSLEIIYGKGFVEFNKKIGVLTLSDETYSNEIFNFSMIEKGNYMALHFGYKIPFNKILKQKIKQQNQH